MPTRVLRYPSYTSPLTTTHHDLTSKWSSYQDLHEYVPLSRHVSDQFISFKPPISPYAPTTWTKKPTKPTSSSSYSISRDEYGSFPNKLHDMYERINRLSNRPCNQTNNRQTLRASSLPPKNEANYNNFQKSSKRRSIIASIDPLTPLADENCPCKHPGADWEDCRIMIQCFGFVNNNHNRYGINKKYKQVENAINRTQKCSFFTPSDLSEQQENETLFGSFFSPNPTYLHLKPIKRMRDQIDLLEGRKSRNLCARSVRLSIIPLNPIYKRKYWPNSGESTRFHSSIGSGIRTLGILKPKQPSVLSSWRKNLIQRMAFKIDDFTIQEDQVKAAKDVFKRFDKRGQEKISTTDLGPAFRALNLTVKPDTLKEWADQVDDDATGFIDFNGFLICYGKKLQEDQDERDLRDAFRVLDKNKRGEIDVEDLRWILKGLGDDLTEEEIDDMIRDTDTDGSGFVDFDEFYKLMTSE